MDMQVFSARVREGSIVPEEGIDLPEGARVTVIVGEADAPFGIDPADESALAESIAEADRGDVVPADELLRRLSR
jgi:hypothetical protein